MSATDRLRAQFEAAIYLFEMSGEPQFKRFADANYAGCCRSGRIDVGVDALESCSTMHGCLVPR